MSHDVWDISLQM